MSHTSLMLGFPLLSALTNSTTALPNATFISNKLVMRVVFNGVKELFVNVDNRSGCLT
jgi:hypothetical protein